MASAIREESGAADRNALFTAVHQFLTGIRAGTRQPTSDPVWVTLEVVSGGFATGHRLAELAPGDEPNSAWTSPEGLARLEDLLQSQKYRVDLPEHGALLAVAWLLRQGRRAAAEALLAQLAPFEEQLRFYPTEAVAPLPLSSEVHLATLGEAKATVARLLAHRKACEGRRLQVRRAHTQACARLPALRARAAALLTETLGEGAPPTMSQGKPEGAWPFQANVTEAWWARAQALCAEAKAEAIVARGQREGTLGMLLKALEKHPKELLGKQVAKARLALACHNARFPTEEAWQTHLAAVAKSCPKDVEGAMEVLLQRMEACGVQDDDGLDNVEAITAPVAAEERTACAGLAMPAGALRACRRALKAPLGRLAEEGIIPSAEAVAATVPRLHAQATTQGAGDPPLRYLLIALTMAFRRRRSLLLVNLESQVRLNELPWVQALLIEMAPADESSNAAALAAMDDVASAVWQTFPETILPNKLVSALRDMSKAGKEQVPFTAEVAADIFDWAFSKTFEQAAAEAAETMENTVYERYFGLAEAYKKLRGASPPKLMELIKTLAAGKIQFNSWSAANGGRCVELQQVLTTHNLAQLRRWGVGARVDYAAAATKCWRVMLQMLLRQPPRGGSMWRQRMRLAKDVAYAWRQLVFFASFAPDPLALVQLLDEELEGLKQAVPEGRAELRSTMLEPLRRAAEGGAPGAPPVLGWFGFELPDLTGRIGPPQPRAEAGRVAAVGAEAGGAAAGPQAGCCTM